jgi:hypothetical protein
MFKKGKYMALMLLSVFLLRICLLNISLLYSWHLHSADTHRTTTIVLKNAETISQEGVVVKPHSSPGNIVPAEVSEESRENNASEKLSKLAKYPSLLLTMLDRLYVFSRLNGTHHPAEHTDASSSVRIHLLISVLTI